MKKFSISRAINDISLNGDEYLLDDSGDVLLFDSVSTAEKFLLDAGEEPEDLQYYTIEEEYYD